MLVNCSNCRTPLQPPPGARSIRCAVCQAVTLVADPRSAPPLPPSTVSHGGGIYNGYNPPAPSPYGQPTGPPAMGRGRKKAVICGISYNYSRHQLKGPLIAGVKLHAIIDACHSGTMLDLPFLCRMKGSGQYVWEDHRPRSGT
ncbi:hypothetical protein Droror1_Dr00011924 [Drosera rotundifolia]